MAGYYDQLETQLQRATERGVPRRRLSAPPPPRVRWRPRTDWIAVGLALAGSIAVAFVFLQAGSQRAHPPRQTTGQSAKPAVIHNDAPRTPPPMGGQMVCDAALNAPRGAATPTGTLIVNTRPPTRFVYRLTATGLKPTPPGEVYEIWLEPETSTTNGAYVRLNGEPPVLLGMIAPAVGASGKLTAQALVPQTNVGNTDRMLITVQPSTAKTPGRVVLVGNVPL
jgi:hypothetical protein